MSGITLRSKKLKLTPFLRVIILICSALLSNFYAFAQEINTVNYTTKDGLPSSQVYDIIQDDYGFLWFSTDKGLSRYDGYSFQNFTTEHGLPDPVVFDFHKRPNGEIWCTTYSARLFRITGNIPTFTEYKFNDTILKYAENRINCGVLFQDGSISFAYHHTQGVLTISEDGSVLTLPNNNFECSQDICCVVASDGEPFFYWDNVQKTFSQQLLGSIDDIVMYKFEEPNSTFEALHLGQAQFFGDNNTFNWIEQGHNKNRTNSDEIISSGLLNANEFWVGYRYGGVEVYSKKGRKLAHYLKEESVTQLYQDHEGNLWVSTLEHGVFKIPNADVLFVKAIYGEKVTSLATNGDATIFIGLDNGSVFQYSGSREDTYLFHSKHTKDPVQMAFHDGILSYSSDQTYQWNQATGKTEVYDICESNYIVPYKGALLHGIGHTVFGVFDYETRDGIVFNVKRMNDVAVYQDQIYGGNSNGLYVKRNLESQVENKVLSGLRVNDLNVFNQQLVVGTNGDGVIFLDREEKERLRITTEFGLNSDFISKTYTENDSVLWVCTNQGINKVTFEPDGKYRCIGMTTEKGLLSNEVWDILVKGDTVWVGTQIGVNYFAKDILDKRRKKATNYFLHWTAIEVKNSKIQKSHEFTHDQNELTFHFKGLSFHTEKNLLYRYRLKGLHYKWHYTTNTSISFSALPPGSYRFIVQVKGENNRWKTNECSYDFIILTPFWKRWWFILLVILMIVGLVYLFFKVRILIYNRDIVREMLIFLLRKIRREQPSITIRHSGKQVKLRTKEIHYVKTDGNYLEVHTKSKKYLIRSSVKKFIDQLPDSLEFIQVHRSYVVRLEHIQQKGSKELVVLDQKIPVGRKYQDQLNLVKTD